MLGRKFEALHIEKGKQGAVKKLGSDSDLVKFVNEIGGRWEAMETKPFLSVFEELEEANERMVRRKKIQGI